MAWVPHSANATTRAWGKAARSPLFTPGRPNHSALVGVSATSRHDPSIATSRRPAKNAPRVSGVAIGVATVSNSTWIGSYPKRSRAWKIAEAEGNPGGSQSDDASHDA